MTMDLMFGKHLDFDQMGVLNELLISTKSEDSLEILSKTESVDFN